VIVVGGALNTRHSAGPLAARLAPHFTVLAYDRRGRGDSGDTPPYAVEREVEDLRALVAASGGSAHVYGHSSGGALAPLAAADGLPVERLAVYEPPYATPIPPSTPEFAPPSTPGGPRRRPRSSSAKAPRRTSWRR